MTTALRLVSFWVSVTSLQRGSRHWRSCPPRRREREDTPPFLTPHPIQVCFDPWPHLSYFFSASSASPAGLSPFSHVKCICRHFARLNDLAAEAERIRGLGAGGNACFSDEIGKEMEIGGDDNLLF